MDRDFFSFAGADLLAGAVLGALVAIMAGPAGTCGQIPDRSGDPPPREESDFLGQEEPDVPYVPTPITVVDRMLEMAGVSADDCVYDLGSGDGRILIRAAERFGARGVGYEINGLLVREARESARQAGVEDLVEFRQRDLFEADLGGATVVTLYLSDSTNLKLRPKLLAELDPGTPVVSHDFRMGDWKPDRTELHEGHHILRWRVPNRNPDFEDGHPPD